MHHLALSGGATFFFFSVETTVDSPRSSRCRCDICVFLRRTDKQHSGGRPRGLRIKILDELGGMMSLSSCAAASG